MATTQPIRQTKHTRKLEAFYLKRGELRNYVLIVFGLHSALRISDQLRLTWDDVYDFQERAFRSSVTIIEGKTRKMKRFPLNKKIIAALKRIVHVAKSGDPLFKSRKGGAIGRVQAYRIIKTAAEALKFSFRVSCHSLRKTFGYMAWKNGTALAVIMEIYNHSHFAITRRYIGVTQDDTDEVYFMMATIL